MTTPIATVSGKVTLGPNGPGVPSLVAWLDLNNTGILPAEPTISVSDANGEIEFSGPTALNNAVVRLILPPAYAQTEPANNFGIHCTVPLGATATANFVIALKAAPTQPPVATPSSPENAALPAAPTIRGLNIGGAPTSDPLGLAGMSLLNANGVRLWLYGSWVQPWTPALIAQIKQYIAAGKTVFGTLNFQDSSVRTKVGPLAELIAHVTAFPSAEELGGPIIFGFGNESNYSAYFTDTNANYFARLQAIEPTVHGKGHKLALTSELGSTSMTAALLALGAGPLVDYIDCHPYQGTAVSNGMMMSQLVALAKQYSTVTHPILPCSSEKGFHGGIMTDPSLPTETAADIANDAAMSILAFHFPLYATGTTASPQFLLDQDAKTLTPNGLAVRKAWTI